MADSEITRQVTAVACQYLDMPEDELEVLLHQAWTQAGLYGVPSRGPRSEFWRDLREYLLRRATKQTENISILTAMVAADVIQWAGSEGIPVDHYSYPVGLLVAWVTTGALKRNDDPGDPDPE